MIRISTVEVDVDTEAERGTIPPTAEEGSKEGTPMDLAPEVVQQSKKSESSSSKKQVMGEGAENSSNTNSKATDTEHTSKGPTRMLVFKFLL